MNNFEALMLLRRRRLISRQQAREMHVVLCQASEREQEVPARLDRVCSLIWMVQADSPSQRLH